MAEVGMVKLAADFGSGDGGGTVDVAAIREKTAQIRALVAQAQADRCAWGATKATYQASMAQIMDHDIGPIKDVADQIDGLLPKVEPPPPPLPPPPTTIYAFAVSYAGHDPAQDCYPGLTPEQREWGPHHGLPLIAPVDGIVAALSFPTPLDAWEALDAAARRALERFWAGWTCWLPPARDWVVSVNAWHPDQTMFAADYQPGVPLVEDGVALRRLVLGHVYQQIVTGRVTAGTRFGQSWNSGINFEAAGNPTARAAHVHCAASASGALLPNGDVPGLLGARALGWAVEDRGIGPGPQDYAMPNRWTAGRRYQDFIQAGRPIPPLPS